MKSDVTFTLDATSYQYMLCEDDKGQKLWDVEPKFDQPPSLIKNRVTLSIKAADQMRDQDDKVIKHRDIDTVQGEIRTLTDGEDITLLGWDDRTYYVTFDVNAAHAVAIRDKSGKITEYRIDIICWDLYQVA